MDLISSRCLNIFREKFVPYGDSIKRGSVVLIRNKTTGKIHALDNNAVEFADPTIRFKTVCSTYLDPRESSYSFVRHTFDFDVAVKYITCEKCMKKLKENYARTSEENADKYFVLYKGVENGYKVLKVKEFHDVFGAAEFIQKYLEEQPVEDAENLLFPRVILGKEKEVTAHFTIKGVTIK